MKEVWILTQVDTSEARPENGFNFDGVQAFAFETERAAVAAMWEKFETNRHPSDDENVETSSECYIRDSEGDETFWNIHRLEVRQ